MRAILVCVILIGSVKPACGLLVQCRILARFRSASAARPACSCLSRPDSGMPRGTSPFGIHSVGITHGDWNRGCEFLQSARALITAFIHSFKDAYVAWESFGKSTSAPEETKR